MTVHHETTTYDRLQAALDLAGLEMSPSEIHGMVCGEICRQLRIAGAADFPVLLGMSGPASAAERSVLSLVDEMMEQSHQALDAGMQFALLLPDDDASIAERTAAVADWARGFAVALLRGSELTPESLDGDSTEVVQDLMKISEARPGGNSEEDERALTELEEYMRVGVQLVFEELQPDTQEQADKGTH